jgi:nucleoside-diphosphate-sugar epimerase
MKIIVTGGAGFIGSSVVWRLNELGHDDILIVAMRPINGGISYR